MIASTASAGNRHLQVCNCMCVFDHLVACCYLVSNIVWCGVKASDLHHALFSGLFRIGARLRASFCREQKVSPEFLCINETGNMLALDPAASITALVLLSLDLDSVGEEILCHDHPSGACTA